MMAISLSLSEKQHATVLGARKGREKSARLENSSSVPACQPEVLAGIFYTKVSLCWYRTIALAALGVEWVCVYRAYMLGQHDLGYEYTYLASQI